MLSDRLTGACSCSFRVSIPKCLDSHRTVVRHERWRRPGHAVGRIPRLTRITVLRKDDVDKSVIEAEWTDVVDPVQSPTPSAVPEEHYPGGFDEAAANSAEDVDEGDPSDVQIQVYSPGTHEQRESRTLDEEIEDDEDILALSLEERQLFKRNYNRNCKILLDLFNAGPALEEKIAQYGDDINEPLLVMLAHRLAEEMTLEDEGDEEMIEMMEYLFRRLRAELERRASSAALRLLDEALQVMNDDTRPSLRDRRALVKSYLSDAFSGRSAESIDIFQVAMQVAAGEDVSPEQYSANYVPRDEFIRETQQFLQECMDRQEELQEQLSREGDEETAEELRATLLHRSDGLAAVEEVLDIARGIVQ